MASPMTATEFRRHFTEMRHLVQVAPIEVTFHSKGNLMVMTAELYEDLLRKADAYEKMTKRKSDTKAAAQSSRLVRAGRRISGQSS